MPPHTPGTPIVDHVDEDDAANMSTTPTSPPPTPPLITTITNTTTNTTNPTTTNRLTPTCTTNKPSTTPTPLKECTVSLVVKNLIFKLRLHGIQVRVGLDDKILRLSRKGNLRFKGNWSDICPLSSVVSFSKGNNNSELKIDLGAKNGCVSLSINSNDDHNKKHFSDRDRAVLSDTAALSRYLEICRKSSQNEIREMCRL